ncbi:MAG: toll/interleukin-1 receptor domain-containing protein [Gemmatales bacterium]
MHKKAFVSHASEDKERFVLDFASKLRANGVDAWLDRWEMLPGDSLVDKIFEEGLKEANAVIVVLSKHSVKKPWVVEELNAAFVKRIQAQTKLIPVLIDDCDVPECLASTLWEKINPNSDYNENVRRIVNSIYGINQKPELGNPPTITSLIIDDIPGLTRQDSIVFSTTYEEMLRTSRDQLDFKHALTLIQAKGLTLQEIIDSCEILDEGHYLGCLKVLSPDPVDRIFSLNRTTLGLDTYLRSKLPEYDAITSQVMSKIVNQNEDNHEIAVSLNCNQLVVDHIFRLLIDRNLIGAQRTLDGTFHLHKISPQLKRMLQGN